MAGDKTYEELREKYLEKLESTLKSEEAPEEHTRQYEEFRKEYMPKPLGWYEKACTMAGKILPLAPDARKRPAIERAINQCHLHVTPEGVTAFSFLAPLALILFSIIFFTGVPMLLGSAGSLAVTAYFAIIGLVLIIPLGKIPFFLANTWRMKASNQMVLAIFYIVTYMRHTSNLELAVDFAAEHLGTPLSLDMKKIVWSIETEEYDSIKESLEAYLEGWRGTNDEFIEAIHLVESSLLESSESRRVEALEKSLSVMLDETYEKMLHYAHNLKGPLTTLHMLGIILPILGLVILPLMVSFIPAVRWYHLALVYNLTLPVLVYYLGRDILSKRPSGYGGGSDEAAAPSDKGKKSGVTPFFAGVLVFSILFLLGVAPLLLHVANPHLDFVYQEISKKPENCILGFCPVDPGVPEQLEGVKYWTLEYREVPMGDDKESVVAGPFGLIATLFSLFVPLAIGLGAGLYYRMRGTNVLAKRQAAKKLELEFASALFQLGNRLADGLPLEIAFSKVAAVLPETVSGKFLSQVSVNITKLGLSVDDALFHETYGAVRQYPSPMIESSMKVLVESARKGPLIASQAIINVSNYIKEMHRVDERLKDLMADVISSMTSQIKFLTPTIAGIVMGITSMITTILGKLGSRMSSLQSQTGGVGGQAAMGSSLLGTFSGGAVGTYFFQLVVGCYVVELIFVLTILVNGIQNGPNKVSERALLGQNLVKSTLTYVGLAFVVILLFNIVASNIVPG